MYVWECTHLVRAEPRAERHQAEGAQKNAPHAHIATHATHPASWACVCASVACDSQGNSLPAGAAAVCCSAICAEATQATHHLASDCFLCVLRHRVVLQSWRQIPIVRRLYAAGEEDESRRARGSSVVVPTIAPVALSGKGRGWEEASYLARAEPQVAEQEQREAQESVTCAQANAHRSPGVLGARPCACGRTSQGISLPLVPVAMCG